MNSVVTVNVKVVILSKARTVFGRLITGSNPARATHFCLYFSRLLCNLTTLNKLRTLKMTNEAESGNEECVGRIWKVVIMAYFKVLYLE